MSIGILILATAALLAAQATNQSWTGALIDDSCHATNAAAKCEVTEDSKLFGVATADGKYFKLDIDGNTKAHEALFANKRYGTVKVSVNGLLDGETIKVESIQIQ